MPADPDLIEALRPVRLPSGFEAFSWPVVCAAFSLGILVALLIVLVLRLVTERREGRLTIARRALAQASRLPGEARLFAQAALLDRLTAERAARGDLSSRRLNVTTQPTNAGAALRQTIGEQLYKPGATPDFAAIDASILKLAGERPIGRNRRALFSRRPARSTGDDGGPQTTASSLVAASTARTPVTSHHRQVG